MSPQFKRRCTSHLQICQTIPANRRRLLFKAYFITEVIRYVLKFFNSSQAPFFDSYNSSQAPFFIRRNSAGMQLQPSASHHKTAELQYFNIEFVMVISNRTYGIIVRTNRMSASQLYAIFYTISTIVQITQNAYFYLLIFIQQWRLT